MQWFSLGEGAFQGIAGYSPPLLRMILIRLKQFIGIKINCHLGDQKMAYYTLSAPPSELRPATA